MYIYIYIYTYIHVRTHIHVKTCTIVGVYLRGPGSIQYGGRPRDSMCILVATVKIIPTTSRVCHLLQLGVRSEESSWENEASKMCVYMPLKE